MDISNSSASPNAQPAPDPQLNRIVSVNSRGGSSSNILGKIVFVFALASVLLIGGVVTFNTLRKDDTANKAEAAASAKNVNKPASVYDRRHFDTDTPPPLPVSLNQAGTANGPATPNSPSTGCSDGKAGQAARDASGQPLTTQQGQPMQVCGDGRIIVPEMEPIAGNTEAIPVTATSQPGTTSTGPATRSNRYGGDILLNNGANLIKAGYNQTGVQGQAQGLDSLANNPLMMLALAQSMKSQGQRAPAGAETDVATASGSGSGPSGSVGSLLQPSVTPKVMAGMLGDRNMILAKGHSIDCGLSMKLVSEVAGLASCVLTQNVYSDNGRVVLLERGSEATGEYRSSLEQGQRRLFVIWTRIKTPNGVVINLDSPGADSLGTTGLPGKVDSHWWQRVGGAFLISSVKDAVAYEEAKNAGNSATGGILYQNTASTGDQFASRVLESTINIKPTLYKNQGDRGTIYVARDLDFGTVYDLRAR
ncbi:type IV secretion system protein VirB10 [Asticcacaulis sp. EMRT-3]|uniref:type IV secretion system protein VirB10 n=1 Tax=Asticcacaulis sp. EMRT-3 TaxID=3040349 RepID=UPI0024AF17B2|nr:type IV secretion system protein VirB10 [Asticcacaulis sp. EMRT-3]MDI7776570.1 type IV secretion system protein VirB10 [Asticcacaulis sp. EMRT-3]